MSEINEIDISVLDDDDSEKYFQYANDTKIDARRRLEARLDDMRLRRELEDGW